MFSLAVTMAPMSLVMVLWQTSPFWISILAYIILKEPIILVEMIGICICFGGVGAIASQSRAQEVQNEAEISGN